MVSPADILNARILVVDDLEANVLLLEGMLRIAGYDPSSLRPTRTRSANFTARTATP
jgi:CheY-like chemotaxis protein